MIKTYKVFEEELEYVFKSDAKFYYELLEKVIQYPERYTGIFRLSNAKTKLIQNVTQSMEIKFGDFMENILTEYIADMGYKNLPKNIGNDEQGNALSADQVFIKRQTLYLIEQKMRDDHDSTKKRGQYDNFEKKYLLLKHAHLNYKIDATMWFIDPALQKNKAYYMERALDSKALDITIHILYGQDLFNYLFKRPDVWNEICNYLTYNKKERSDEVLTIPDFDTSPEILQALRTLKKDKLSLFKKLYSDQPKYKQLRNELFPTEHNLKLAKL